MEALFIFRLLSFIEYNASGQGLDWFCGDSGTINNVISVYNLWFCTTCATAMKGKSLAGKQ